ncbi:unnamed protein product [Protopolystoma xenopodis]|uniref:Uncharacterized protein n=1 Tax=Protopolystoma xenopodis TaxID=117903 RepID=A0A448WD20_9PLAT|nr:unnamed protein product [Protopolystoma xenopodis]
MIRLERVESEYESMVTERISSSSSPYRSERIGSSFSGLGCVRISFQVSALMQTLSGYLSGCILFAHPFSLLLAESYTANQEQTQLLRRLRPCFTWVDDLGICLAGLLRRRPYLRFFAFLYILLLHLWMAGNFFLLPNPSGYNPSSAEGPVNIAPIPT